MSFRGQVASTPVPTSAYLAEIPQNSCVHIVGLHYIYLLPSKDQNGIKIGKTDDPTARIPQLKKTYPDIDLAQSVLIAVDTSKVETILKIVFESRGRCVTHRLDGFTEWFDADIKEEVVDFCLCISECRRFPYAVQRGLQGLIDPCRNRSLPPEKRRRRVRQSERELKESGIVGQLCHLSGSLSYCFRQILSARYFDRVYRDGGEYFLARTVYREEEPECWESESRYWASTWSRKIRDASEIRIKHDTSYCFFRFVATSFFEPQSDEIGREYFLMSAGPEKGNPRDDRTLSPVQLAFRYFWRDFGLLPVEDLHLSRRNSTIGEVNA